MNKTQIDTEKLIKKIEENDYFKKQKENLLLENRQKILQENSKDAEQQISDTVNYLKENGQNNYSQRKFSDILKPQITFYRFSEHLNNKK